MDAVDAYLDQHQARYVDELIELLRVPSVSADPAYRSDVRRAAEFVRGRLIDAGCHAERVETAGHPIVFGRTPTIPDAPTVLIYGNYDVQPADIRDGWDSDPFEPVVRDDTVYARGATDDKGQFYTHIKAIEAWSKAADHPPINAIFVIEGEEEVGSDNLEVFLSERR